MKKQYDIFDQLAANVTPGTWFNVQRTDLDGLSANSLVRLAHLFAKAGDNASLKRLIETYAAHDDAELDSRWRPWGSTARDLARAIPEHLADWVVDKAIALDGTREGAALTPLAERMIRKVHNCGTTFLIKPSLKELAEFCEKGFGK